MKRGFTILELLVASLLLGMLVSVLTMLFNQSSISWRTGVASVEDLDEVRNNIALLRDEADNVYIWGLDVNGGKVYHLTGLWNDKGELRKRAWDINEDSTDDSSNIEYPLKDGNEPLDNKTELKDFGPVPIEGKGSSASLKTYMVNVKSAGPNKIFGDYDDIWSYPDAIEIE